eukprot:603766-Rhodomonas_salina.4
MSTPRARSAVLQPGAKQEKGKPRGRETAASGSASHAASSSDARRGWGSVCLQEELARPHAQRPLIGSQAEALRRGRGERGGRRRAGRRAGRLGERRGWSPAGSARPTAGAARSGTSTAATSALSASSRSLAPPPAIPLRPRSLSEHPAELQP